jgi:hypothetical protein
VCGISAKFGGTGHFVAVGDSALCAETDESLRRCVAYRRHGHDTAGVDVRGGVEQLPGDRRADPSAPMGTTDPYTRFHAVAVGLKPGSTDDSAGDGDEVSQFRRPNWIKGTVTMKCDERTATLCRPSRRARNNRHHLERIGVGDRGLQQQRQIVGGELDESHRRRRGHTG